MRLAPQEIRTFFITSVTHERRSILQTDRMARLFLDVLQDNRTKSHFLLHEFVVMPNHFHLLITPAYDMPLEKGRSIHQGRIFLSRQKGIGLSLRSVGAQFYRASVKDADDYEYHRAYIHENPVRRGMVRAAEEYSYSSAYPGALVDSCPPALKRSFKSTDP